MTTSNGSRVVAWDTNCLLAILSARDENHRQTKATYDRHSGDRQLISVHSWLECFSVLTRRPKPWRISPKDAIKTLELSFGHMKVVGLEVIGARSAMQAVQDAGFGGGAVYDAAIAQSVAASGATVFYTWNLRHFVGPTSAGLDVREPS